MFSHPVESDHKTDEKKRGCQAEEDQYQYTRSALAIAATQVNVRDKQIRYQRPYDGAGESCQQGDEKSFHF
jgi:hypothetical protein